MTEFSAITIGAGPAGCAAAALLAAWGHPVLLLDRGGRERTLAESIPPSAQKVLGTLGMLTAIEDAGFQPWLGNTVWWGDHEPRIERFPPGAAGYQVVRAEFDRMLRELARRSGATIQTGAAREVVISTPAAGDSATGSAAVTFDREGRECRASARIVLDCSGRSAVIGKRFRREPPARTIAVTGIWRADDGWGDASDTHTLVASYEDGWAWSIATGREVRYFTAMVDPARTSLLRGVPSVDVYRAELGKIAAFAPLLARATLVDGPWGADASTYAADRHAGPGFLLAGDAGSFVDPLSSSGVKKALASGWLAAIAVHTALVRPSMAGEALAFFERRERAVAASAAAQAGQFAQQAGARSSHPFWLARSAAVDDADPDDPDPSALARDPEVLAAFEDLRRRPTVHFCAGPDLRFAPRAAIRGHEIVLDEHLFVPAWPEGIRYLRNVDLVALSRLAQRHTDVGALCDAVIRDAPRLTLPDLLGALAVLVARGALRHS